MSAAWVYREEDTDGFFHERSHAVTCARCGGPARLGECADVGGAWVFCACGVYDVLPSRDPWAARCTRPEHEHDLPPLWA